MGKQRRVYRSFKEARAFARGLEFTNRAQWTAYCKGELEDTHGLKPNDIPAWPPRVYEDWVSSSDWLGTERVFLAFIKARELARGLKLKNQQQWVYFAKGALEKTHGIRPREIPSSPHKSYKDKGWVGYGDWLGTGNLSVRNRVFRPFPDARKFARELQLSGAIEWQAYAKGELEATHGLRPHDIPSSPAQIYHDKGWRGTVDWLGTEV